MKPNRTHTHTVNAGSWVFLLSEYQIGRNADAENKEKSRPKSASEGKK